MSSCCASEELHKNLGRRITGAADLNWPEGYFTSQNVMPNTFAGGVTWKGGQSGNGFGIGQ